MKNIGRENNSDFLYFIPNTREQFILCEAFAQKSGMVQNIYFEYPDGRTHELSSYSNGRLFRTTSNDEIIVEDSDEILNKEQLKKILQEKSQNTNINNKENKTMAKKSKKNEPENTVNVEINPNEKRKSLQGDELWYDFNESMKKGYEILRDESEGIYPDFMTMFKDRSELAYTREQKQYISKKIAEFVGTNDRGEALSKYEKKLETDYEIEHGAEWEFNENNEKVLKTSEPYTQQDKENAIKNNEIQETVSKEDVPETNSVAELRTLIENLNKERQKEQEDWNYKLQQFEKQNKQLEASWNDAMVTIQNLRDELALYKENSKNVNTEQVKEYGSQNQNLNNETENSVSNLGPDAFTRNSAWKVGTKIPRFGFFNAETRTIEPMSGFRFLKYVIDEKDPLNNKIIIEKDFEDGSHKQIQLTEAAYKRIIAEEEKFEIAKNQAKEGSWEWYLAYEEHDKALGIDSDRLRSGSAENFDHNFTVCCKYAANFNQAMDMAKKLFDLLPKNHKKRFNKRVKDYGKEQFDEHLRNLYEQASKDKKFIEEKTKGQTDVTDVIFEEASLQHPGIYLLQKDEKIPGTNKGIGDTIKMAMSFKGLNGKKRKTPATDFKIVAVTRNLEPGKAVVYSEAAKCKYEIPLKSLVSHIQKVEKLQQKEEIKEHSKDKNYEFSFSK